MFSRRVHSYSRLLFLKKLYFQNKVGEALTEAGYNPRRLDRWGYGLEMEKDGVTFSERSPVGFYSLAEKAAKEAATVDPSAPATKAAPDAKAAAPPFCNWQPKGQIADGGTIHGLAGV